MMEHNNAEDHIMRYSSCVISDNQSRFLFFLTSALPNTIYDTYSVTEFIYFTFKISLPSYLPA